jgi:hypothetical protein
MISADPSAFEHAHGTNRSARITHALARTHARIARATRAPHTLGCGDSHVLGYYSTIGGEQRQCERIAPPQPLAPHEQEDSDTEAVGITHWSEESACERGATGGLISTSCRPSLHSRTEGCRKARQSVTCRRRCRSRPHQQRVLQETTSSSEKRRAASAWP